MAIITPKLEKFSVEEATIYLESVGEWHTVRNVPRDVMVKWAEYLRNREDLSDYPKHIDRQDCVGGIYETPVKK
jgi:hypothetical protein